MLLPVVLLLASCGGSGASTQTTANLLQNPGFEQGADPWHTMPGASWSQDFDVGRNVAHSGAHSVHVNLVPPSQRLQDWVFGVAQDINTNQVPEYVSGDYRVENWLKGTPSQYLQFVVIVFY